MPISPWVYIYWSSLIQSILVKITIVALLMITRSYFRKMIHVFLSKFFLFFALNGRQNSFLGSFDIKKVSYLSHKQYQPNRNPCSNKFLSKPLLTRVPLGRFYSVCVSRVIKLVQWQCRFYQYFLSVFISKIIQIFVENRSWICVLSSFRSIPFDEKRKDSLESSKHTAIQPKFIL